MSTPFPCVSANLLVLTAFAALQPGAFAQELPATKAAPLTTAGEAALKPKDSFKECELCPEMVVVTAGSFTMGSPEAEVGRYSDEGPQRKVTIAKAFAVGKFEITFAEWDACVADSGCKHNPGDRGWGRGRRPAINISWKDLTEDYLPWLRRKTGKVYRLLTEAEWEYAARAGSTTRFPFGDDEKELCTYGNVVDLTAKEHHPTFSDPRNAAHGFAIADCRDRHAIETAPAGSFKPNAFGLYDMYGNVSEVTEDCYWPYYASRVPVDGSAHVREGCDGRVERGGSWADFPRHVRSAYRSRPLHHDYRNAASGSRVARTLD